MSIIKYKIFYGTIKIKIVDEKNIYCGTYLNGLWTAFLRPLHYSIRQIIPLFCLESIIEYLLSKYT